MGIMVYSLLWVMQDFVHQQYQAEEMHDQMEARVQGLMDLMAGEPSCQVLVGWGFRVLGFRPGWSWQPYMGFNRV